MKRVRTLPDPMLAGHVEEVLRQAGIACVVKNRHLAGGVGELPAITTWPEIWVMRDEDAAPARALIDELLEPAAACGAAAPWICPVCKESIEAQFSQCWNCAGDDDTAA